MPKDSQDRPPNAAAAESESGRMAGLADSLQLYGRVLGGILAVAGLCFLVGLQSGWIGLVWDPDTKVPGADDSVDPTALRVVGPKNLFSRNQIAVDTGRTYRLDADVRVLPKKDGSNQISKVYFGVSTYDASGKELKTAPGTYRYAGANGKAVVSAAGWMHLSGTITGEGNENHHQFRPGTHSIKLVLLANYRSEDAPVMLIRNVTFSELVEIAR